MRMGSSDTHIDAGGHMQQTVVVLVPVEDGVDDPQGWAVREVYKLLNAGMYQAAPPGWRTIVADEETGGIVISSD
jgi:hypothetical protein